MCVRTKGFPIIIGTIKVATHQLATYLFLLECSCSLYFFPVSRSVGNAQFEMDYVATHTRIITWLVGLALGFTICAIKARKINIQLSKVTKNILY